MRPRQSAAGAHWRGHLFLFGSHRVPTYGSASGRRLLLVFVVLEAVIGPRLSIFQWLHLTVPPAWVRIPLLLALALVLVRYFAGVEFSQIGLAGWSKWSATEKSYFLQVVVIANAVFIGIYSDRLRSVIAEPAIATRFFTMVLPYLLWGFYQELMYRGILQTELVRRWGAIRGIVVSNVLFTFGPLHFYHFSQSNSLPMFAGIFVTGLFFAIVFDRSGNLWMVGTFHGIGDAYIEGTR